MWKRRIDERTLWMDITAHEKRFTISLGGHDGPLAKEAEVLDDQTIDNLQKTLGRLTSLQSAPGPDAFHKFGALLFEVALPEAIQQRLAAHDGPLVFATQELTLPWELLCIDRDYLCLKHSLSRQLRSLSRMKSELLGHESLQLPRSEAPSALIIANPCGNLPAAEIEAEEIASILAGQGLEVHKLIGKRDCTYHRILAEHMRVRPHEIIHFCGHAVDLPAKETSGIPLADGGLLMAQDIQRTFKGEPLVFLNACWSAKDNLGSTDRRGYSGASVARTLAEAFTVGNRAGRVRAIVGSLWWTFDHVAQGLAGQFYREIFRGLTAGEALRTARNAVRISSAGEDPAVWTTYVLFGEPGLSWVGSDDRSCSPPESKPAPPPTLSGPDAGRINGLTDLADASSRREVDPVRASPRTGPQLPVPNEPRSELSGLSDGLPWSNELRVAFVGALAAMTKMHWHIFSTIHLILGLTYLDQGLIVNAMRDRGHGASAARRKLRKLFSIDRGAEDPAETLTSPNVKKVLLAAKSHAAGRQGTEVTEADLVLAMLGIETAGSVMLLKSLKIDIEALRRAAVATLIPVESSGKLAPPKSEEITLPNGSLNLRLFDADLQQSLEEATWLAYRSYWPDLRSPHLFLGILNRKGSRLARHMAESFALDAGRLSTAFLVGLTRQQRPDAGLRRPKLNREFLSENALSVLRKAQSFACSRQEALVTERHVLESILGDATNIVASFLQQMNIDPHSLIWPDRVPGEF